MRDRAIIELDADDARNSSYMTAEQKTVELLRLILEVMLDIRDKTPERTGSGGGGHADKE